MSIPPEPTRPSGMDQGLMTRDQGPRTKGKPWRKILVGLVVLAAMAELALQLFGETTVTVEIVNKVNSPAEGVVVRCGGHETRLGTIAAGGTATARVSARGKSKLVVDYRQKGSVTNGIDAGELDLANVHRERQKVVFILHDVGYEQHDEDDPGWIDRAWQSVKDWFSDALWG
jgi:hypothetical protein